MGIGDKRPGAYILIAFCDAILRKGSTPGGLWYDNELSMWASNRYAANAASMV